MVENYIKVIVRSVFKNKLYTFVNVLGLALGFTAVILTSLYLYFETSFDKFHTKSNRIYRPTYAYNSGNGFDVQWARIPRTFINELPNDIPEIEHLVRFQNHERKYIRIDKHKFKPRHAYVADHEVFKIFDLPLLSGNPETALSEPNSVVITASLAMQYFGTTDALNKEIYLLGDWSTEEHPRKITGIMADLPPQTHLPIDMLLSFQNEEERSGWAYIYVLLREGADIESVTKKMPDFIKKHANEDDIANIKFEFQALERIHLHSNLAREIVPNGSFSYVKIFAVVGIFILFIALVNYINLNSALILARKKELSLRMILGSKKQHILMHLLLESVTINVMAMSVALLISWIAWPYFSSLTGIQYIANPWIFAGILLLLAIGSGIISGILPAFSSPKRNPLQQLKSEYGASTSTKSSINAKKILISLQFAISLLLIGSAFIARDQFKFLNKSNLGMDRRQILTIPGVPDGVRNDYVSFKEQLMNAPGILGVASCMEVPSREIRDVGPVLIQGINSDPEKAPRMDIQVIDHDYIDVLGIELIAGENLPASLEDYSVPALSSDYTFQDYLADKRQTYLINETAMNQLGWENPEDAIGQEISWSIGSFKLAYGPIVGVVKDYHQETLKNEIDPTILVYEPMWLRTFLVKVDTDHIQEVIKTINSSWDRLFPLYPLEYRFLDDLYNELYKNDRIQLQLLYLLSGLAILISFIGLFGLIAYSLQTRLKEIAIRRVLGANTAILIRMIAKEYVLILAIAAIIAIPISYHFVRQWLLQFAYKVNIEVVNYLWTFAIVLLLILVTISLQTIKTSWINPADTLRDE